MCEEEVIVIRALTPSVFIWSLTIASLEGLVFHGAASIGYLDVETAGQEGSDICR